MIDQKKPKIKPALLLIDAQNHYLKAIPQREKEVAIYFINLLIDLFHEHELPVIVIYHHDLEDDPAPGTDPFEYPSSIHIRQDDPEITKNYSDSFNKTELDNILKEKGCNTLFLCGQSAVGCVLATRIGAFNHDYKALIVKDAIMSHNTNYTRNVEDMFGAVNFDVVKMIVENF
jgi:nicotinamidase-related amidase